MSQFFKSKFFIIILIVALILVIVPSVLSVMGLSSQVRSAVGVIFSPVTRVFTYVADAAKGFTDYFTEFDRLSQENEELKERISNIQDELYDARLLQSENEWLYDYLALHRAHTDYELEPAKIISREAGNYLTVFTLDRGTSHGIAKKMPVITSDGIVGYVIEVGATWCKVATLIETATSVGAFVERTGEVGVVEGEFSLRESGVCRLKYIDEDADIEVGDRILSSGLGEVYPRGLIIGEVSEIVVDSASRTKTAIITPTAAADDLERVMIIKSFNAYVE